MSSWQTLTTAIIFGQMRYFKDGETEAQRSYNHASIKRWSKIQTQFYLIPKHMCLTEEVSLSSFIQHSTTFSERFTVTRLWLSIQASLMKEIRDHTFPGTWNRMSERQVCPYGWVGWNRRRVSLLAEIEAKEWVIYVCQLLSSNHIRACI